MALKRKYEKSSDKIETIDHSEQISKRHPYPSIHPRNQRKERAELLESADRLSGGCAKELLIDTVLHDVKLRAEFTVALEQDFTDNLTRKIQHAPPSKKLAIARDLNLIISANDLLDVSDKY